MIDVEGKTAIFISMLSNFPLLLCSFSVLLGAQEPGVTREPSKDPALQEPCPCIDLSPITPVKSIWEDCDRYDFVYQGNQAIVVVPNSPAKGNPWIWRPAFFGAFPTVDKALLKKGFHIVYYDLTHRYGSPDAVDLGTEFYNYVRQLYKLSDKVTLEGFSRGGLYAFNWASKNPEKIACIYVDAPVCNVMSWPGRKQTALWKGVLDEWKMKDDQMDSFPGNPTDEAVLKPIAQANIPIISVCGDADKVVPFAENMKIVRDKYAALGGPIELIIKPGVDHHPHSLDNPEPVVDFIQRHQPEYEKFLHITPRGSLHNSYIKFEKEKKGRVAFLGGSITRMTGWVDEIQKQLKQRFPYTEFEFINAGIPSTGSTPGAFRLQNDVLSKGEIDLLFVEAAVNDDTNGFKSKEQIRGMEGEVRHTRETYPNSDIVMLHFIYDPFIPQVEQKKTPEVLTSHEKVADHYKVPSINLIQEIGERMMDKQLTWQEFGGTHPAPLGHKYYAAAINHLFDKMWAHVPADAKVIPHALPKNPLDPFSYSKGDFIDIKQAKAKGWNYVESWKGIHPVEKRPGFVDVPMLEATTPGAELTLDFKGSAIGLFCATGPSAGILEYSIDGSPFKKLDTFTPWSGALYIPWVFMLETELNPQKTHSLKLKISEEKHPNSKGNECQIRNFVVNKA